MNSNKKSRSSSNLTFIESPSVFLTNLSSRSQSRSEIEIQNTNSYNSMNLLDIQRVKSELANVVQSSSNKNDMELRQLINQISQIQIELKPKIISLESQQELAKKKILDLRQQIKKISEDIPLLQKQYDQLNDKFDKFVKVDVETKIIPLSDDTRQAYTKVHLLSNETDSSIKQLNKSVKEIAEKINLLMISQLNKISSFESINELIPCINFLEMHLAKIKQLFSYLQLNSQNYTIVNQQRGNNINFNQIDELNSNLSILKKKLKMYIEQNTPEIYMKISNLQNDQYNSKINSSNISFDSQSKLLNKVQNKVKQLKQDYDKRFGTLDRTFNSTKNSLEAYKIQMQYQANKSITERENESLNTISIKNRIDSLIQRINESINISTNENITAQKQAAEEVSHIKSQIEGNGGALHRLQEVENKIISCLNTINEVNQQRAELHKKGSGNFIIIKQIENLEKRLEIAEKRLQNIDKEKPTSKPNLEPKVEDIKLPKVEDIESLHQYEMSSFRPPKNRFLPTIPEKFFPDDDNNFKST